MANPIRVVKIGGSLLERDDLAATFLRWLSKQSQATTVAIVGGGKNVRALKQSQWTRNFDDEMAHFAAIDVMFENAIALMKQIGDSAQAKMLDSIERIIEIARSESIQGAVFFDCRSWAERNQTLPRNWSTTSDSIAAAVAVELNARELVLLKSILPKMIGGRFPSLEEIAASDFVDAELRNWIVRIPKFRFVNLALEGFPEMSFPAAESRLA